MAFVSGTFIFFLLIVFLVYFLIPKRFQWMWLLAASYIFYAFSSVRLLIFLILTTVTIFYAGKLLDKINKQTKKKLEDNKDILNRDEKKKFKIIQTKKKRKVLGVAIFINLGILIFLKYFNFFGDNINSLLTMITGRAFIPRLNLLLPLGISFYTFQSLGYVIDVYRGKYDADKHLGKFALFISFFPQIIQGPISRYDQLAHQLTKEHFFEYSRVTQGIQLILWGFFKKLVIADRVAIFVNNVFDNYQNYEGIPLFIGAAFYGIQVYTDFTAGMDIARGVSQILGIEMVLNFERPYFARSISEFWRRWHITLGSWMKDYVFYPLSLSKGFNRMGKKARKILGNEVGKMFPTFVAMFITFLLVGVWHGSSWKYVAYGIWNGGIIAGSILLEPLYKKTAQFFKVNTKCFSWSFFQMSRTFFLCSLGRVFSRADSCMIAFKYIKRMFQRFNPWVFFDESLYELGMDQKNFQIFLIMLLVLLIVGLLQERGMKIRETLAKQNIYFRWIVYIGAVVILMIYGVYGPGYSSTEFIYQQF